MALFCPSPTALPTYLDASAAVNSLHTGLFAAEPFASPVSTAAVFFGSCAATVLATSRQPMRSALVRFNVDSVSCRFFPIPLREWGGCCGRGGPIIAGRRRRMSNPTRDRGRLGRRYLQVPDFRDEK